MSDENGKLLRRAWAAYDSGDFDAFAACLTDDWREYDGQGDVGTVEDDPFLGVQPTGTTVRRRYRHAPVDSLVSLRGRIGFRFGRRPE